MKASDQEIRLPSSAVQALSQAADAMGRGDLSCPIPSGLSPDAQALASALEELKKSLLLSREKQQEDEERRRNAIASIAHDLRVPLTTILGYAEALQKGLARTEEKKAAYINAILLRSHDMSRMIDELSLTNKAMGHLVLHPALESWTAVIRQCLAEQYDFLTASHVTVHADLDDAIHLMLDRDAFRHVLDNLMQNTVKYREKNTSSIILRLTRQKETALFSYHDDGPGVPAEALPHIFEPWYRASSKTDGSGLGLYIISQIVSAHHGLVSARNDHGLTIEIQLPVVGGSSC